jgi:hypothetical protein
VVTRTPSADPGTTGDAEAETVAAGAPPGPAAGPLLFARYAYPPNALGYCGPADSRALLQYGATGVVDGGLAGLARGFSGAWPYLELIAASTRIPDPLDARVVEAYWIGNPLLDRIGTTSIGDSIEDRFRRRTGLQFPVVADGVVAGGLPHHSFHVFCVYPWAGMLGDDARGRQALEVLDRCRIRWGRVTELEGDRVVVRCQPLEWDGASLSLGEPALQEAIRAVDGLALAGPLRPGDWVALHWDWICDRLSRRQLAALRRYTALHLGIVNRRVSRRAVAAVLD